MNYSVLDNDYGAGQGCHFLSDVSFFATEFTPYYILVQSSGYSSGSFALTLNASSNFLALVGSKTDKIIEPIWNGELLRYSSLSSPKLSLLTSFNDTVRSAMVIFGNPRRSVCEKNAPFAVFGNNQSNYFGVTIPLGPHTVTATPYNQANCKGRAGIKISKSHLRCVDAILRTIITTLPAIPPSQHIFILMMRYQHVTSILKFLSSVVLTLGLWSLRFEKRRRIESFKQKWNYMLPISFLEIVVRSLTRDRWNLEITPYELNIDGIQHVSTPFTAFDNGSCK